MAHVVARTDTGGEYIRQGWGRPLLLGGGLGRRRLFNLGLIASEAPENVIEGEIRWICERWESQQEEA